jgi:hypothetical protein
MRYESSEEVEADMKLVFDNAIKYNPPGHPIHMQVSLLPRARRREWAMKRSGGEHGGWVWHSLLILSLALVHSTLCLALEHQREKHNRCTHVGGKHVLH